MGFVRVSVQIANPDHPAQSVTIDAALVDTGATTTTVPRELAQQLGLPVVGTRRARTIDGVLQVDVARALVMIEGEQTLHDVFVSDTYANVLIGVVTLELLGFAVDPVNLRLVPVELLLL